MRSIHRALNAAAIGGLMIGMTAMTPATASPESSALIDDGIVELQNSQWKEALGKFLAASIADAKDAEAQFFQGVALNRLGLHREALGQIELARKAGVKNAEMDFEYGWALLGSGQSAEALKALTAYKNANPDSGKTSELIGRGESFLGNDAKANTAFAEAVRLDPQLQASVDFFKASQAAEKNDSIRQGELLESVAQNSRGGALSSTMKAHLDFLRAIRPERRTKPWNAFGSLAIGRNSNVIALSEGILRPAEITRTDSRYIQLSAGGQYRRNIDTNKAVIVGGVANRTNYRDITSNDSDTFNVFARYEQKVTPRLLAAFAGSFTHVRVDGDKLQNTVGVSPSLEYQVNDVLKVSGFASSQKINLPSPTVTPGVLDRDSKLHSVGGNITFAFPSLDSELSFGTTLMNNSAVGSDYDYNAHSYSLKGRTKLPWDIVGGLGFTRTNYDFKNLNSLAPTTPAGATAFGFARDDAVTTYSASLTRPINEMFTAYARASRTNANSNLVLFTYDQKDIQIGVTARF